MFILLTIEWLTIGSEKSFPIMHLAALCSASGANQGSWMYLVGKFFRTGRYFLIGQEIDVYWFDIRFSQVKVVELPYVVSVRVSLPAKPDGTVAVEELLEKGRTRQPHPHAGVYWPVSVKEKFIKHLKGKMKVTYWRSKRTEERKKV